MGMLVLARQIGQTIVIDPDGLNITVMVTDAHEGAARLGIDAPRTLAIHRMEVWRRVQAEREAKKQREGKSNS